MSRRWPAEWEKQDAVWISWPHREDTWPGKLPLMQQEFSRLINLLAQYQVVRVNVADAHLDGMLKLLVTQENIEFYNHPTDDVWCRDHGATFVVDDGKLLGVDWHFNAWGGKFPPWSHDDEVAARMADSLGVASERSALYLEGGAIEGNGAGVVMTTEAVALNSNRNPGWSKLEVEEELMKSLGAESVFWLPRGIEGDDTDGHIDDLTRFVKEDAVVSIVETNPTDPNYAVLQENLERLQDLRTVTGSRVETVELPMPDPLVVQNWRLEQLPASYANFLILNGAVIVPTFDQYKNDERALGILRECFSGRNVVGVDCRNIVFEGGAIHCITQQQPAV